MIVVLSEVFGFVTLLGLCCDLTLDVFTSPGRLPLSFSDLFIQLLSPSDNLLMCVFFFSKYNQINNKMSMRLIFSGTNEAVLAKWVLNYTYDGDEKAICPVIAVYGC